MYLTFYRQKTNNHVQLNQSNYTVADLFEAIDYIDKKIGLNNLKQSLYLVALARKNNPEDSLFDIAEKLAISKSCLNHRIRKIMEIATQLMEKGNV